MTAAARRARAVAALCALPGALGCTLDLSGKHDCRDNSDCVDGRLCFAGTCHSTADGTAEVPNYVFVTSAKVSPVFETVDAADAICGNAASAVPLPGHFRAWLSTSEIDARDRLQGARGWIRTDGAPFADTVEDVTLGRLFHPASLDEHGSPTSGLVVTGTGVDGRADATRLCDDWSGGASGTAIAGTTDGTTGVWTSFTTIPCGEEARLYCFGIDHFAPVAPPPPRGKLAFLSDDPFVVGDGLAAADDQCQREATAAHLPGTFRALLASPGAAASSRVQANLGVVWSRVDGIALSPTGSTGFLDAATMLAPLNVTSGNRYMDATVFTGAADPETAGNDQQTCAGWTAGSGAVVGRANYLPWWFASGDLQPCTSTTASIYCFQSD
jgi:hypothetical protein